LNDREAAHHSAVDPEVGARRAEVRHVPPAGRLEALEDVFEGSVELACTGLPEHVGEAVVSINKDGCPGLREPHFGKVLAGEVELVEIVDDLSNLLERELRAKEHDRAERDDVPVGVEKLPAVGELRMENSSRTEAPELS